MTYQEMESEANGFTLCGRFVCAGEVFQIINLCTPGIISSNSFTYDLKIFPLPWCNQIDMGHIGCKHTAIRLKKVDGLRRNDLKTYLWSFVLPS